MNPKPETGMKESRRRSLADRILESRTDAQSSLDEASRLLRDHVVKVGSSVDSTPNTAAAPPVFECDEPAPPEPVAATRRKEEPLDNQAPSTDGLVRRAYHFAEIHRLREKIVSTLQERQQQVVLATGPHDNAGTSTLMALLAYNAAFYSSMSILLADVNMRNPGLHEHFGKHLENGFRETAAGLVDWQETVKDTDLPRLKLITAGRYDGDLFPFINRPFLDSWIGELKQAFDLIFLDTSPILMENRNNVDPVLLSLVGDMTLLVVQDKKTRKGDLRKAARNIAEGGGKIEGVVYNLQYHGIFLPLKRGAAG